LTSPLAIGDGSLGFWIALQEECGPIAQQRCWVSKAALAAYDQYISSYQTKFPKASALHPWQG
jgi:hypothetical protein